MDQLTLSAARPDDLEDIQDLLSLYNLPAQDVGPHLGNFIVARAGAGLAGVVGLEAYGRVGLLRSLAVSPERRGRGLGQELYARLLAQAGEQGIEEIYLLTTTAEEFFSRRGHRLIDRAQAPAEIQATAEFQGLCPVSARVMYKSLSAGAGLA